MMTLAERGKLANAANADRAAMRAAALADLIAKGEGFKRAAYTVGVSERTARRYRAGR